MTTPKCPHFDTNYFGQELPPNHECPPCELARACFAAYNGQATEEKCATCERPATIDGYCRECYNAIETPDPLCKACGEPLPAEDAAAGETICLKCAGVTLLAEVDRENPLLARVEIRD